MRYIGPMRKGAVVEVRLTGLDAEGAAVGRVDDLTVHVAGGAPDERVSVRVEHRSPHRADVWATLLKVVEPSAARVAPACPAYGSCGGCRLEHLDYAAQLAWKTSLVRELLSPLSSEVAACVPSPRPLGYRNREKRVFAEVAGRRVLGAYAPRTHDVVDLAGCRVSEPPLDEVAAALCARLQNVRPHSDGGTLRYAVIRVNHAGQVLLVLITATREFPDGESLARDLVTARPELVGVVQNLNDSDGNVLQGAEDWPLYGVATLEERVGPVRLRLSPTSFFQANREIATRIYSDARDAANLDGSERVVDAYCGVGGLALTLAPGAREVLGIESHAASIADARASAELNGAANARFEVGDAAEKLQRYHADVVVLNPPRKGCAPELLSAIEARRILYVSCNPDTLARDLSLLAARGYRLERAQPYDMLPQTSHVEVLAVLTRP